MMTSRRNHPLAVKVVRENVLLLLVVVEVEVVNLNLVVEEEVEEDLRLGLKVRDLVDHVDRVVDHLVVEVT